MPPPLLQRRMSMPVLRDGQVVSSPSVAAAAQAVAAPPPPTHVDANTPAHDDQVRPPAHIPDSVAPAAAPAKVLVKRRKANTVAASSNPMLPEPASAAAAAMPRNSGGGEEEANPMAGTGRSQHAATPHLPSDGGDSPRPIPLNAGLNGHGLGAGENVGQPVEVAPFVLPDAPIFHSRTNSLMDQSTGRSEHPGAPPLPQPVPSASHRSGSGGRAAANQEFASRIAEYERRDDTGGGGEPWQSPSSSVHREYAQPQAQLPPPPPPLPPPPKGLAPPPKRVSQFVVDEAPLPQATDVKSRVEQAQAAERAREEVERLQQPWHRRPMYRRFGADDDDTPSFASDAEGSRRAGGIADFATAAASAARERESSLGQTPAADHRSPMASKSERKQHAAGLAPSATAICFSLELEGINVLLYEQLAEKVQNRIAAELGHVLFDAVRGPVPRGDHIVIEHFGGCEDGDGAADRATIEGSIRGVKSTADRRLIIRLLVSYIRGSTNSAFGEALMHFPALVHSAGEVVPRRLFVNDVDVVLAVSSVEGRSGSAASLALASPYPNHNVATVFEERRKRMMVVTPSVTMAETTAPIALSKEVSPRRYPDRSLYHHITTPTMTRDNSGGQHLYADVTTSDTERYRTSNAGLAYAVAQSPGMVRYRTRRYEYS